MREEDIAKRARQFWEDRESYPSYPYLSERDDINVEFISSATNDINIDSILDIGCGDCRLAAQIAKTLYPKNYYAYDISQKLLTKCNTLDFQPATLTTSCITDLDRISFPEVSLALILGLFLYLTDKQIVDLLKKIEAKLYIIRTTVYLGKSVKISKFSEELGAHYAAIYRSLSGTIALLEKTSYNVLSVKRAYPDHLESKYGSFQYFIVMGKK